MLGVLSHTQRLSSGLSASLFLIFRFAFVSRSFPFFPPFFCLSFAYLYSTFFRVSYTSFPPLFHLPLTSLSPLSGRSQQQHWKVVNGKDQEELGGYQRYATNTGNSTSY